MTSSHKLPIRRCCCYRLRAILTVLTKRKEGSGWPQHSRRRYRHWWVYNFI